MQVNIHYKCFRFQLSMKYVDKCPRNQTEVDEAAARLGCGTDKYGNNQYICLPNTEKTSLVEICYDEIMGIIEKGMSEKI